MGKSAYGLIQALQVIFMGVCPALRELPDVWLKTGQPDIVELLEFRAFQGKGMAQGALDVRLRRSGEALCRGDGRFYFHHLIRGQEWRR